MSTWQLIFKKLLGIVFLFIFILNTSLVFAASKTEDNLEDINVSKSQIEEILDFFSGSFQNKIPIDPDVAAIQFGYENFEEFAKQYLKLFKLTDI